MSQSVPESGNRVEMSANLRATLQRAGRYAAEQRHRLVTIEHILLALNEDPEAELILNACAIDQSRLHNDVSGYLSLIQERASPQEKVQPVLDNEAARIVNSAVIAAQKSRRDTVNGAIVLAAIIGDGKTPAANMLSSQGLTFQAAIDALQAAQGNGQTGAHAGTSRTDSYVAPHSAGQMPIGQTAQRQTSHAAQHWQAGPPDPGGTMASGTYGRADQQNPAAQRGHTMAEPMSGADKTTTDTLATFERRAALPPQQQARVPQPAPQQPAAAFQASRSSYGLGGDPLRRPPPPEALSRRPSAEQPYAPPHGLAPAPQPPGPSPQPHGPNVGRQFEAYGQGGYARDYHNPHYSARAEANKLPAVVPGQDSKPTRIIRAGQLLENIPRRMRMGMSHSVEVRIARSELQNLAVSMRGGEPAQRHEPAITKVMSVRMRAPDNGFFIEASSPETQWIENQLSPMADEFASWRWIITPKRGGRATLQLIVAARTVGGDGLAAQTALPDQLFDIRISVNYARVLGRWAGWIAAAVCGGLLAKFGEDIVRVAAIIIHNGTGGGGIF